MADVPVGASTPADPAPSSSAAAAAVTPGAAPAVIRRPAAAASRAEKLAAVSAGLAKLEPEGSGAAGATGAGSDAAAGARGKPASPAAAAATAAAGDAPAGGEPGAGGAAKPDDKPDEQTAKGLSLIDKRAKAFREEMARDRAQLDVDRAQLAQLRSEVDGRGGSIDKLRERVRGGAAIEVLRELGIETEEQWEMVGRGAFPFTREGRKDPRAQAMVAATTRERELQSRLDAMESKLDEFKRGGDQREQRQQAQQFVQTYLDGVIKAIPADTPSLIGKLVAKSPDKARQALFAIGARMERAAATEAGAVRADGTYRYDPDYTPSHAAVLAQYELERRAELEDQGVDVDALLGPPAAPAPTGKATKPAATLDPSGAGAATTRPRTNPKSREEKLAAVTAGLKRLEADAR